MINFFAGLNNNISRLDTMEEHETRINWGNLMGPGPVAIGLLSSLVLVTANNDVNLTDGMPAGQPWVFVKRPGSLRASLAQVANEAHDAMLKAHSNMQQIEHYTSIGKGRFESVRKVFKTKDVATRKLQLPVALQLLADIVPECRRLAKDTVAAFQQVSNLISELLEGCISSQSVKKTEKTIAKQSLEILDKQSKALQETIKQVKKDKERAQKKMDQAEAELKRAIKSKPGFGDYLGAAFCDMVSTFRPADMIKSIAGMAMMIKTPGLSTGMNMLNGAASTPRVGGTRQRNDVNSFKPSNNKEDVTSTDIAETAQLIGIFRTSVDLQTPLRLIKSFEGKTGADTSQITTATQNLQKLVPNLKTLAKTSKERHLTVGVLAQQLEKFVSKGASILSQLQKEKTGTISIKPKSLQPLITKAKEWEAEGAEFKATFDRLATKPKNKPLDGDTMRQVAQSPDTASKISADYKTQIAANEKLYKASSDNYDKQVDRLDEFNKQSIEMIKDLMKLKFREQDLEEAIKTLEKAIEKLGLLKEQWSQLQMFFEEISGMISVRWYEKLNEFIEFVKPYEKVETKRIYLGNDLLYQKAFEAARLNYRVFVLARTYMLVSENHLMPPLRKIPTLFSKKDQSEIDSTKHEIEVKLKNAQEEIRQLLIRERDGSRAEIAKYVAEIDENFAGLCTSEGNPEDYKDETEFKEKVGKTALAVNENMDKAIEELTDLWTKK